MRNLARLCVSIFVLLLLSSQALAQMEFNGRRSATSAGAYAAGSVGFSPRAGLWGARGSSVDPTTGEVTSHVYRMHRDPVSGLIRWNHASMNPVSGVLQQSQLTYSPVGAVHSIGRTYNRNTRELQTTEAIQNGFSSTYRGRNLSYDPRTGQVQRRVTRVESASGRVQSSQRVLNARTGKPISTTEPKQPARPLPRVYQWEIENAQPTERE
jgi:hypothetical protein